MMVWGLVFDLPWYHVVTRLEYYHGRGGAQAHERTVDAAAPTTARHHLGPDLKGFGLRTSNQRHQNLSGALQAKQRRQGPKRFRPLDGMASRLGRMAPH
jgi:hypothetical protein